jgi:hypothetical protein
MRAPSGLSVRLEDAMMKVVIAYALVAASALIDLMLDKAPVLVAISAAVAVVKIIWMCRLRFGRSRTQGGDNGQ